MGYWSSLHLVDVKIKAKSLPLVSRALKSHKRNPRIDLQAFFARAVLDSAGFLAFKTTKNGSYPYVPDEDDGTVPALNDKWYQAERIARWLKRHSEKGGRIVLHSTEADGAAWGWEFDGKGRMRALNLMPVSRWL
jgi:hypothetical protein